MLHIRSVSRREIYTCKPVVYYKNYVVRKKIKKKSGEEVVCLTTSFVFFFFSLPSISSSLSNKHFALFVSVDCHGDNSTRVTAQPAPRYPGLVDQCRRNRTRTRPSSSPQAADHDAHRPRMQKCWFPPLPWRRLSAHPSVPDLQVERRDGKNLEEDCVA